MTRHGLTAQHKNSAKQALPAPGVHVAELHFSSISSSNIYQLEFAFRVNQGYPYHGKEAHIIVKFTPISLWLVHGNMFPIFCPKSMNIPSGSELILDLFPVFRRGRADEILSLGFDKGGLIYIWWFGRPSSDAVMTCSFLLLPGVSVLLPVSRQIVRAS